MVRGTAAAFAIIVSSVLLMAPPVVAQNNYDNVSIEATKLADNVYMLTGAGGNIGVFTAADGAIMVDAQYAPLKDKITAAIAKLSDKPIKTLINSHFHRDHTDGNAAFAAAGVSVIAQQNVYDRLQANEDFDRAGLPQITFSQQLAIQTEQGALQLEYYPDGHTDGDIITWFPGANVIHAGDLFFVDRFPFIDLNAGGTVDGYINNVSAVISKIDDDTQIIPGHGSLSDKSDWQRLVDMIKATRAEVVAAKAKGLSEAEVIEQGLSDKWQDWSWNFITEKRWIETLYRDHDATAGM
ncbi:Glyoxylase, beta-lactamase superfamily II [Pseudidiomarina planktonica]|uniref:Glyoxylase, beta-lactamase superfamily II n=1 Tax=Pseudidiomarina planktonica TaxID=1323738 RepID=A0A1Y6EL69_9GAMM|nr:MBL fold metallo-hydrolase [Pseudidiomarina planktonica]RUO65742.1 MBL fold metallo-hydrolase [Pseudidiomarina planktonica]SMQ63126.1 Glyoxylase, beta-lactamase superfamily II [Pseudidiomarina planktonica]